MQGKRGVVIGFAIVLLAGGSALAQQSTVGRGVLLSRVSDKDQAAAFCKSHQTGLELQMLVMTGNIGQDFVAGDLEEINGNKLTVKLLKGDVMQPVQVADEAFVCLQDKKQILLKNIPLSDVKVGSHVFGSGELDHGVFVVHKVLYVMVFASDKKRK